MASVSGHVGELGGEAFGEIQRTPALLLGFSRPPGLAE